MYFRNLLTIRRYSIACEVISNKMNKNIHSDYESAVSKLNTLISNVQYIQNSNASKGQINQTSNSLVQTKKYLIRSGLELENLDDLSVIHVTGTKGKGSTCALTESILRSHGYKTGFFSSPHLFEVRERIRINGKPLDKQDFADHFWKIYDLLDSQKKDEGDMPLYFGFMTLMAFHVFLSKKVDVAILEVGIGGEFDCTNIIRKLAVGGITSIGIDHTVLLGDTIESIAWNKGGIMKENSLVYTVPQNESALNVLRERSIERKCSLEVIEPKLQMPIKSNFPLEILSYNASLAMRLSEKWIETEGIKQKGSLFSSELCKIGLESCEWPGRFDIRKKKNITYYMDGAHTTESIEVCTRWFTDMTKSSKTKNILMFNLTGERNSKEILNILFSCKFDTVIFVPNVTRAISYGDNILLTSAESQMKKCEQHKTIWKEMLKENNTSSGIKVFSSVVEAIDFLKDVQEYNMLVTGSIHLVGAVLNLFRDDAE